jgi:hypothetical protein
MHVIRETPTELVLGGIEPPWTGRRFRVQHVYALLFMGLAAAHVYRWWTGGWTIDLIAAGVTFVVAIWLPIAVHLPKRRLWSFDRTADTVTIADIWFPGIPFRNHYVLRGITAELAYEDVRRVKITFRDEMTTRIHTDELRDADEAARVLAAIERLAR